MDKEIAYLKNAFESSDLVVEYKPNDKYKISSIAVDRFETDYTETVVSEETLKKSNTSIRTKSRNKVIKEHTVQAIIEDENG